MIKAALFDVDGTLLDTTEFIFQAYEHTLNTHKLSPIPREELTKLIGQPLGEIYKLIAPSIQHTILMETHKDFQKQNLHLSKPFPQVVETLKKLHEAGIKLAAITSRSRVTSANTLELAGIKHFFDIIVSMEDVTKLKPDPEPLLKALDMFHMKPEDAVMIGDTYADVQAGQNTGTKTIAVSYGFHGAEVNKHKPDYLVHKFEEILPIILNQATK